MSIFGDFFKQRVMNHIFDQTSSGLPRPGVLYLHLHTDDPGDDGSLNEVDVLVWTNYEEKAVNTDHSTSPFWETPWLSGTDVMTDNSGSISFGTPVMDPDTATISATHGSLKDGDGSCWFKGPLNSPVTIQHGVPIQIVDGAFDITFK